MNVTDRRSLLKLMGASAGLALAPRAMAQNAASYPFGIAGHYGTLQRALKRTVFLRRNPAIDADRFAEQWIGTMGPIAAKLPGLSGFTFNVVDRELSRDPIFDAVAEYWYPSEAAQNLAYAPKNNGAEEELQAKAATLIDSYQTLYTHEVTIRDDVQHVLPPGGIKRFGLIRRKNMTRLQFLLDWRDHHAEEANNWFGLVRYSLNVTVPRLSPDAMQDGYAELWWKNREAYDIAAANRQRELADLAKRGVAAPSSPVPYLFMKPLKLL